MHFIYTTKKFQDVLLSSSQISFKMYFYLHHKKFQDVLLFLQLKRWNKLRFGEAKSICVIQKKNRETAEKKQLGFLKTSYYLLSDFQIQPIRSVCILMQIQISNFLRNLKTSLNEPGVK